MKAFTCNEGTINQLQYTTADLSASGFYSLELCVGSATFSESTTLGSVSIPSVPSAPLGVLIATGDWTFAGPPGACTMTLNDQSFTTNGNPGHITLDGWVISDANGGVALWCGSISPTFTPNAFTGGTYVLQGITVTLGECVPIPPSVTTLLSDTMGGAGSITLASHTPSVGGPWTDVLGTLVVTNGACSATATGDNEAFAPAANDSVTLTIAYVHDTLTGIQMSVRAADNNNQLHCFWSGTTVEIQARVGGVDLPGIATNYALTSGTTYTFRLACEGTNAIAYADDSFVLGFPSVPATLGGDSVGFDLFAAGTVPLGKVLSVSATRP